MRDEKCVVTLNSYEQRLMVRGLTDFRNDAIQGGKPTEDVDDLIIKVINAPIAKPRRTRKSQMARYRDRMLGLLPKAKDTEFTTEKWRADREAR